MPQDPRTGQRVPNSGSGSPLRSNGTSLSPSNAAGYRRNSNSSAGGGGSSSPLNVSASASPRTPSSKGTLQLPSVTPVDAEPRRHSQAILMASLPEKDAEATTPPAMNGNGHPNHAEETEA